MRRFITLSALFLVALTLRTEPWSGAVITVASGTAVRIVSIKTISSSIVFQMQTGGTGRGYVLYANPAVTCAKGSAGTTLIAEIPPATSTAPGLAVVVPMNPDPYGGIDAQNYCVDGSHTGDGIIVAWNQRN